MKILRGRDFSATFAALPLYYTTKVESTGCCALWQADVVRPKEWT